MLVRTGDHTHVEARARAEAAGDVVTRDYYTLRPQIRLTAEPTDRPTHSDTATEIILDGNDVAKLVECAIRHPSPNMWNMVQAAIWNHPETFRQIFEFGLDAPEAFQEIREIVAKALAQRAARSEAPAGPGDKKLLPRMPLPAHLRDRRSRS